MKGNNKVLRLSLIIYVIIILCIIIFNLAEPLFYGKNSSGKKTDETNIYDVAHGIIAKKYEKILYESGEDIYSIFSYNCKSKLDKVMNSDYVEIILNSFDSFQITSIEKANKNKYIIYYTENFENKNINENKMVFKYKNDKAIIYYDSILEESNE